MLLWNFEINFLAFQFNLSCILTVDTEQTLHQGGFTGAILSHQRVYRSLFTVRDT